uniref:Orf269b n=1 Tax=Peronospora tabacina TaxID=230439 RepID=A0A0P0HRS5_9STRA|nr:orf269b [Peronospora tabacina]ALJ78427.1 orf269b [Peronospora tabacina]ALJ78474.1 orf269b [Peronospora tabacina]
MNMSIKDKNEFFQNLELRNYFRLRISQSLETESSDLPSLPKISMGPSLDANTIVKLNQLMSPEEKKTFLTNVINFQNADFNIYYLILNSSVEVRTYIIKILTHSVLGMPVINDRFYAIINIYLYILANNRAFTSKDVLELLKTAMLMYDPTVLDSVIFLKNLFKFKQNAIQANIIPDSEDIEKIDDCILNKLKLLTEEQLEQNKNDFYQQVEEHHQQEVEEQEKKKSKQIKILKIFGISVLCQIGLVALGFPPLTRVVNKAVKTLFDGE